MSVDPRLPSVVGSTSTGLLVGLKAADQEAWRRFVHLYAPLVYRWCRQAQVRPEDAADIGQEVFRSVAAALPQYRHAAPGDTFRGWLWAITRNKILDHVRRQAARPQPVGGTSAQHQLAELPEPGPDGSSLAGPADPGGLSTLLARGLQMVRGEFEDRTWQAFWRVAVQDEATAAVAAELGMTLNAVRKAKSRVLARLRTELGDMTA